MSIINEVLNELEKRGVSAPLGETTLRPVVPRKRSNLILYALMVALLLVSLAIAKWYTGLAVTSVQEKSVVESAPTSVAALAPSSVEAVSGAAGTLSMTGESGVPQSADGLHGKPLLEVKNEEEPVVVPELKKTARSKPEQARGRGSEEADSFPAENPELLKKVSPLQRAENEFRKANLAVQEGRTNDALAGYESALLADPTFKPARRAWAGLLVSLKRNDEAEPVLQRGLRRDSHDATFAMMLARLQVERDAIPLALETLLKTLPFAEDQADYQSFVAALLQRQGRHEEAIAHYQIALKLKPDNGVWLMGMGMSLQALQRNEEARDAYQRALATKGLNAQLQGFVQEKLKEL